MVGCCKENRGHLFSFSVGCVMCSQVSREENWALSVDQLSAAGVAAFGASH